MTKIIALLVAGMLQLGRCSRVNTVVVTKQAGNNGKVACSVSLASLNLTSDQQAKMDKIMAEHHKAGCSEASEAKYMKEPKVS